MPDRSNGRSSATMPAGASLLAFLVVVVGGGLFIGWATAPGAWYAALRKPAFNPPGWVFGPVWTVLYVLIAVAGWRVYRRGAPAVVSALWAAQLILNFAWSPAFFGLHRIDVALGIVLLLLVTVLSFIGAAWRHDRLAALLFVPYAAWVAFAAALNFAILQLN